MSEIINILWRAAAVRGYIIPPHSYRNSETIGLIVIEIDVVLLTNGKNSVHFARKVMFLLENMVHCPNIIFASALKPTL